MNDEARLLEDLRRLEPSLREIGAVVSGEAAAHVHLAAATGSAAGGPIHYRALAPARIQVLCPEGVEARPRPIGVEPDQSAVGEVLRARLDLFTVRVSLADGTTMAVLSREAVLAELLEAGGLSVGLAGLLVRLAAEPPLDVDEVREILKAARQPERFQPLLELLAVA